ncbi:Cht6p, partial [Halocaridina rubra]
ELRDAFEDEGRKVNKGRLLLTMAVPAGQNYIDKGYDLPSLSRDLDFFNILNYDYHSAYEPNVNHHAALMAAPGTSEYEWNAQLNVDWTVKYYIKLGAEKQKLVIGLPTYGRSFTLIDGNFTDFGASADGPGEQGKYTREKGFMAFYEVCENIASHGWEVRKPYPRRIGPYAFSGNQWVGYDDEKIVARKAEYVREHDLGGIMFWSLDNDDFRGVCNGEEYPLIEAGKKALFSGLDASLNDARNLQGTGTTTAAHGSTNFLTSRTSSRGSSRTRGSSETQRNQNVSVTRDRDSFRNRDRTRLGVQQSPRTRNEHTSNLSGTQDTTSRSTQTPARGSSRFGGRNTESTTATRIERIQESPSPRLPGSPSERLQNRRRPGQSSSVFRATTPSTTTSGTTTSRTRPGGRRRPQQGGRRQQSTTTIDPLNTPSPPTTPSPVSSFTCKREGFYPNPDNCHKYYWCLDSGASGLGIVAHAFTCPSGLVFNKIIDGCDHADRAKCNTEQKSRGGTAGNTTPGSTTPIPTTTEIPTDYSYYDDYYYYDYDDQPLPDLPAPVEEVSNNVGRQFQNSAGNQFQHRNKVSEAIEEEITSEAGNLGGRTRPQYTSISRDRPQAGETSRPEAPSQQQNARGSLSRPEYTTIQRERPAAQSVPDDETASVRQTPTGERQYVTIERRRPGTTQTDGAVFEEPDYSSSTEPALEYVTLDRSRGRATSSSASTTPFSIDLRSRDSTSQRLADTTTTSRYVTLQRSRPSTTTTTTEETVDYIEEITTATSPVSGTTFRYWPISLHPSSTTLPPSSSSSKDVQKNFLHDVVSESPDHLASTPSSFFITEDLSVVDTENADDEFIPASYSPQNRSSKLSQASVSHKVSLFHKLRPVPIIDSVPQFETEEFFSQLDNLRSDHVMESILVNNRKSNDTLDFSVPIHSSSQVLFNDSLRVENSLDFQDTDISNVESVHNLIHPHVKDMTSAGKTSEVDLMNNTITKSANFVSKYSASQNDTDSVQVYFPQVDTSMISITNNKSLVTKNNDVPEAVFQFGKETLNFPLQTDHPIHIDSNITDKINHPAINPYSTSLRNESELFTNLNNNSHNTTLKSNTVISREMHQNSVAMNEESLIINKLPLNKTLHKTPNISLKTDILGFSNIIYELGDDFNKSHFEDKSFDNITDIHESKLVTHKPEEIISASAITPAITNTNRSKLIRTWARVKIRPITSSRTLRAQQRLVLDDLETPDTNNTLSLHIAHLAGENNTQKTDFMFDTTVSSEGPVSSHKLNHSTVAALSRHAKMDDTSVFLRPNIDNSDFSFSTGKTGNSSHHPMGSGAEEIFDIENVVHDNSSLQNVISVNTSSVHEPGSPQESLFPGELGAALVKDVGESLVKVKNHEPILHGTFRSLNITQVDGIDSFTVNYEDYYYYDDSVGNVISTPSNIFTDHQQVAIVPSSVATVATPPNTTIKSSFMKTPLRIKGRTIASLMRNQTQQLLKLNYKEHSIQDDISHNNDHNNYLLQNFANSSLSDNRSNDILWEKSPDPISSYDGVDTSSLSDAKNISQSLRKLPKESFEHETALYSALQKNFSKLHGTGQGREPIIPEELAVQMVMVHELSSLSNISNYSAPHDLLFSQGTVVEDGIDNFTINFEDYYYYDDLLGDVESSSPVPFTSTLASLITTSTSFIITNDTTPTTPEITTQDITSITSISTHRPMRTHTSVRGQPITAADHIIPELPKNMGDMDSFPLAVSSHISLDGASPSSFEEETVSGNIGPVSPNVLQKTNIPSRGARPPRRRVVVRKRVGINNFTEQTDSQTTGPRLRVPQPTTQQPTVPPSFGRQRTNRPDVRPNRPQLEARPTHPQSDNRRTRPHQETRLATQVEDSIPTRPQTDVRPSRPLIVPRPRPTTLPPIVVEEETIVPPEEESFTDTTIIPLTSALPSLEPLSPRPQPVTPAQTSPFPRPSPTPKVTTISPFSRPRTTRPRPVVTTPRPVVITTSQPPARSPRPSRPAPSRTPAPAQSPAPSSILSNDYYDYYYDDLDGALTGTLGQLATLTDKAILMADGSVQCYDTGYFAHPDSCKKFISCSKTVRGLVRGWVYTCPEQLVFDPVGGMCNWAEAVDCAGTNK